MCFKPIYWSIWLLKYNETLEEQLFLAGKVTTDTWRVKYF